MFEYVASGTAHLGYNRKRVDQIQVYSLINDLCIFIRENLKNHQLSFLFNAYVEPKLGEIMNREMKELYAIHSDSGGLQIVTQGKTVTPDIKQKIYNVQNSFSNVAMCFDEIPVSFVGETGGGMNDNDSRYFDKDKFYEVAALTGKNLQEQIEMFVNEGIHANPMLIIHGKDIAYMKDWCNIVLEQIHIDNHKHLHGIATSGVSLGTGELEDVYRAAIVGCLDIDSNLKKNMHMLGVGSIRRMLPVIELYKSGFIDNKIHISYDSSSHTMTATMAEIMDADLKKHSLSKSKQAKAVASQYFEQYHSELFKKYNLDIGNCVNYLSVADKVNSDIGGKRFNDFILAKQILVMTNIYHFMCKLDKSISSVDSAIAPYNILQHVKTKEDFYSIMPSLPRYFKSKKICDSKITNIMDMFV